MTIILLLAGLMGILHLIIMALEMFASPEKQSELFDMPIDFVKLPNAQTALKNIGIYNGALGLAILASFLLFSSAVLVRVQLLFMLFIVLVGLFGGKTVTRSIYFIQALPGALVAVLLFLFM